MVAPIRMDVKFARWTLKLGLGSWRIFVLRRYASAFVLAHDRHGNMQEVATQSWR